MKKNSKDLLKEVNDFFESEPDVELKTWSFIHDFYHIIMTHMDENNIKQIDVAEKLGVSRAAISQLFKSTPNITAKKMVELADAIGLTLKLSAGSECIPNSTTVKAINDAENGIGLKEYSPMDKMFQTILGNAQNNNSKPQRKRLKKSSSSRS